MLLLLLIITNKANSFFFNFNKLKIRATDTIFFVSLFFIVYNE
jgi:hypothetical protein